MDCVKNRMYHVESYASCEFSGQGVKKVLIHILGLEETMDQLVKTNTACWNGHRLEKDILLILSVNYPKKAVEAFMEKCIAMYQ